MLISWRRSYPFSSTDPTLVAGAGATWKPWCRPLPRKARIIGAGTIGIAAIWTLIKIIGPIFKGIGAALAANRARGAGDTLDITERDLPITIVGGTIIASMIPIALLLATFAQSGPIAVNPVLTIALSILYILVAGVVIASVTATWRD